MWQVNISSSKEYIGWILVRPMNFFSDSPEYDNLELGWRFTQSSWGKGYASEAALHLKNALAKNGDLQSFSAIAVENNLGSIAVMKKIGMSYVKSYLHKDPLFESQVVYYQIRVKWDQSKVYTHKSVLTILAGIYKSTTQQLGVIFASV